MAIRIDLQNDDAIELLPTLDQFHLWVESSLQDDYQDLEQTIRIVNEKESKDLNRNFRGQDVPTNVLSFPSDATLLDYDCFGDMVLCAPVIESEAREQGKTTESHWAHMVVHGMLHLQGFDHQSAAETAEMEALEIRILSTLGLSNPYND